MRCVLVLVLVCAVVFIRVLAGADISPGNSRDSVAAPCEPGCCHVPLMVWSSEPSGHMWDFHIFTHVFI